MELFDRLTFEDRLDVEFPDFGVGPFDDIRPTKSTACSVSVQPTEFSPSFAVHNSAGEPP